MKLNHGDLEVILNRDSIDEQSEDTLRALLKVEIKSSSNPKYKKKMEEAHRRIQLRLSELENERKKKEPNWNRIRIWTTLGGLALTALIFLLKR
jgi:hypothetical protein